VSGGTVVPMITDLGIGQLHGALQDPALTSMNFLNEIAGQFPDAISFAAGRPYEGFFDVDLLHRYLGLFRDHLAEELGYDDARVTRTLLQYGPTKGVINDLVARHLRVDEGMDVDPGAIVVTVGCQEAMVLVLRALRAGPADVLLAVAPTYVGLSGAARLVDMPVRPVAGGASGLDLDDLVAQITKARQDGLCPRALYVMPDFANPSGVSLDAGTRLRLLDIAEREDILLLEDNPYGLYHGDHDRVPALKALDTGRRVVYLGTFAKTVLPGARVGYVVADQRVAGRRGDVTLLADELSKIKSMLTVNTSPIAQAVVAGKLLDHGYSLAEANKNERLLYAENLRRVVDGLSARFPGRLGNGVQVKWNLPSGGFFVVVTVPFPADDALLDLSAREYGVLWTPMGYFYAGDGGANQLRLSCSQLTTAQIDDGLDRLAALIADRTAPSGREQDGPGKPPHSLAPVCPDRGGAGRSWRSTTR
jgi:(S)-3,5-dihydroxyphenylglycine transaminase